MEWLLSCFAESVPCLISIQMASLSLTRLQQWSQYINIRPLPFKKTVKTEPSTFPASEKRTSHFVIVVKCVNNFVPYCWNMINACVCLCFRPTSICDLLRLSAWTRLFSCWYKHGPNTARPGIWQVRPAHIRKHVWATSGLFTLSVSFSPFQLVPAHLDWVCRVSIKC